MLWTTLTMYLGITFSISWFSKHSPFVELSEQQYFYHEKAITHNTVMVTTTRHNSTCLMSVSRRATKTSDL
jgi:hypothetical protein